jgi:dTDP-glucose 4,6-dehydratase
MEDLITEPYLTNKVVVITGAAGFIGSHLVDKCLDLGAIVIGVDNFITGRRINLAHLQQQERFFLVEADVSTPAEQYLGPALEQVQSTFPEAQAIEVVFHLASPALHPLTKICQLRPIWSIRLVPTNY